MQCHLSRGSLAFGLRCYCTSNNSIRWCISNHVSFCGLNSNLSVCPCSCTTCWVVWACLLTALLWTDLGGQSVSRRSYPSPLRSRSCFWLWLSCFLKLQQVLSSTENRIQAEEMSNQGLAACDFDSPYIVIHGALGLFFYHWQPRFSATASWWLSLQVDGVLTWCK